MVWKRQVLVVANVTATSAELVGALTDQAARQPVAFTLVVPATPLPGGRDAAGEQLDGAVAQLRELGLDVDGRVGDVDPMVAVLESWDPRQYDEIIVSTLPTGTSKWLHADLPRRVQRQTGALVTHVVARPPKQPPRVAPIRNSDKLGVMTPLSVLTWSSAPRDR
jgi:hypothetical protein